MNHFQCPCGFAGMRFAWHCACGEHPDMCDETCACGLPRPKAVRHETEDVFRLVPALVVA